MDPRKAYDQAVTEEIAEHLKTKNILCDVCQHNEATIDPTDKISIWGTDVPVDMNLCAPCGTSIKSRIFNK